MHFRFSSPPGETLTRLELPGIRVRHDALTFYGGRKHNKSNFLFQFLNLDTFLVYTHSVILVIQTIWLVSYLGLWRYIHRARRWI